MSYLDNVRAAFSATLTRQWWTELREASVRQAMHVTLPILLAIAASGVVDGDAVKTALVAVLGGEVVVIGRRLLAIQAPAGSGMGIEYGFRAVSTFAGSVLGSVLAVDTFNVLDADWGHILTTAAGATTVALIHGWGDRPGTVAQADSLTVLVGHHGADNGYVPADGTDTSVFDTGSLPLVNGPVVSPVPTYPDDEAWTTDDVDEADLEPDDADLSVPPAEQSRGVRGPGQALGAETQPPTGSSKWPGSDYDPFNQGFPGGGH